MPKEGTYVTCPNKECGGIAIWVCLGEPEGDFYSCESCNGSFDKNWEVIGEDK